jgi:hypothetical protein
MKVYNELITGRFDSRYFLNCFKSIYDTIILPISFRRKSCISKEFEVPGCHDAVTGKSIYNSFLPVTK